MAFEFTDTNFQESVLDKKGVVVVDFGAEWCGPCRALAPIIDELATEMEGKVTIGKLDVDQNKEASLKYGIRNIPTILFFRDGELVEKHTGSATKSMLEEKILSHVEN